MIQQQNKTTIFLKCGLFIASVYTLSLFFAGWRQINQFGRLSDWVLLLSGTFLTVLLIVIQGYWIYIEEKAKGHLTKKISFFDAIQNKLQALNTTRRGIE